MNKPFLKWAGNKFRVLPHLLPHIGTPKRYCEPFGGSFSVAFNVTAKEYILNDVNKDLIAIYQNLLKEENSFIQYCEELFIAENNTKESFLEHRKYFNQTTNLLERARLFVYLNRHCFNGLSRYNSKGEFNVPFGKYAKPVCPSEEMMNFRNWFLSKQLVRFTSLSFEDSSLYENLEEGDVVYMDPPYIPLSDTANFTNYSTDGFSHQEQIKVAEIAEELSKRGVKVIISNHDVPVARELYKNATIYSIQVSRTIAAKGGSRKKASEIIAVYE